MATAPLTNFRPQNTESLYFDLLKRCLINWIYRDTNLGEWRPVTFDEDARLVGHDWPSQAHTMIGLERLNNLQFCCETVIQECIPGDFVETGVWRGGASIFMRGVLSAYRDTARCVWVCDSFEGLPKPNDERYPTDAGDRHHTYEVLKVDLQSVKENFARYGLLDDQVEFVKGWFSETLHQAPISKISVLRLDGDMYESTIDALTALYSKVSRGGFIIVDDYKAIPGCKEAVDQFRFSNGISDSILEIDWAGVYWRKL